MRSFVESTFVCLVTVTRAGIGKPVRDPETGEYVDPPRVTVYDGKALVYARELDGRRAVVGDANFTVSKYVIVLPTNTAAQIGDKAKVTQSPDQPNLTRLDLTLVDVPLDQWGVALQCIAEAVERP
jgi:hypothetical protein